MAYRAYRAEKFKTIWIVRWILLLFRGSRDLILFLFGVRYDGKNNTRVKTIKFLGLWDSVAAYGLPIDEMARGFSQWIWPLELPNRSFDASRIDRACHALSLDDERTTFHPVLWNEQGVPSEKLSQVWFAGVHSNVGGGYPDDSLAHIPLYWIMTEAKAAKLKFKTTPNEPNNPDPDMMVYAEWRRDKDGRLYDSRNGLGGYYRYGPRKIEDLSKMRFSLRRGDLVNNGKPTIHETAITRALRGAHRYAPIGIPKEYSVLTDGGIKPQSEFETSGQAETRCAAQERIWNVVWRRRIIYFVSVFASIYIAIYPLARTIPPSGEFSTRLDIVSSAIRATSQVLPGAVTPWIEAYARDPSHFLVLGFFVVLLIWLGVWLGSKIEDRMERIWRAEIAAPLSKLEIVLKAIGLILGLCALAFSLLPMWQLLPPHWSAQSYITISVDVILVATLVALFSPNWLVFHLRTWFVYRGSIRFLKLWGLPFIFAMAFLAIPVLFGSHIIADIEAANGKVCVQSASLDVPNPSNDGLKECRSAGVASCSGNLKKPTCPGNRAVYCGEAEPQLKPGEALLPTPQPICAQYTRPIAECDPAHTNDCSYLMPVCRVPVKADNDAIKMRMTGIATCPYQCETRPTPDKVFDISSSCTGTGIWVDEGEKYNLTIKPNGNWKDRDISVSTRGLDESHLSLWGRFIEILKWPLKRRLFVEPFKVIARVGSFGNDERVLEPDDNPNSDVLDAEITPRQGGELFLYVNEAVWAGSTYRNYFYEDNTGTATIAVHKRRQ